MAHLSRSKGRRSSTDRRTPAAPSAQRRQSLTDPLLRLQRSIGNSEVLRLYGIERLHSALGDGEHDASAAPSELDRATASRAAVVQREDDAKGASLGERIAQALMSSPRVLSDEARRYTVEAGQLLRTMQTSDPLYDRVYKVYWGFGRLISELKRVPQGQQTSAAQRQRANSLALKWRGIRGEMAARNKRKARAALKRARAAAQAMQRQVLYAYRDIYLAGEEPKDVAVGAGNVLSLAEKAKDLLKAINEADAGVSDRSVKPYIPVLDNVLSLVKLIAGWKVTSGLVAQSQADIAALQNAWSLTTTALSITGFGKFLPLFGHIGPMLDGIAKGWDRVVRKLQAKNRRWWEARDVVGDKLPHPAAVPGGGVVFNYMKSVFRASQALPGRPSAAVVSFFHKNREMFSKAAVEVMGESWDRVPTKSNWVFWRKVDPDKLNQWVYDHRDTVWRLIYGRGWDPPK